MSRAPRPVTPTTILGAHLTEIYDEFDRAGTDPALLAKLGEARDLARGLDPYLDANTSAEPADLASLARATAGTDWGTGTLEQEMLSGHVEGALLQFLVRALRARTVLEIGMFSGYSALAMAMALPPGGTVLACEIDEVAVEFARAQFARSEAGERITVAHGPATGTLEELADAGRTFDFVFIDADKGGYTEYLDAILRGGLLAEGGLIAVDNTLMQGDPWLGATTENGRAIAQFNERVRTDDGLEHVLIPLRDGITLIRPTGSPAQSPTGSGS